MNAADQTTPEVLELLARYLEANNRWAEIQDAPDYDSVADTQAEQDYIKVRQLLTELDPATLRAQAAALASKEAVLRKLAQRVEATMGVHEHLAATKELTEAILTPTQEAQ